MTFRFPFALALLVISVIANARVGIAAQSSDESKTNSAPAAPLTPADTGTPGAKHAIIIGGLGGDAEHRKQFAKTARDLHARLIKRLGFSADKIHVLVGDELPAPEGDAESLVNAPIANREEVEKQIAAVRKEVRPEDSLWVFVFGHAHYDGRNSWLNLPGPDVHQADFAKWFDGLVAQEQVFWILTPASGFYVKALSGPNRIVITATEADWETNETEFPNQLVEALKATEDPNSLDVDQDGTVTLFDLYLTVTTTLARSFAEQELILTEHALLDDNGDGRGTEVQIDFITTEFGGRVLPGKKPNVVLAPKADGHLARKVVLPK